MQIHGNPTSRFVGRIPDLRGWDARQAAPPPPQNAASGGTATYTNTTPLQPSPIVFNGGEPRIERMSAQATFRIMKELKEFHEHPDTNLYVLFSSGRYFWLTGYKGSLRRGERD
jgi:hypothetical protein